jgi:autotransporter-associated beta strand protein
MNGRSVLHFDGTDQLLQNNLSAPETVFIVNRVTANSGLAGIWGANGTVDYGVRETGNGNAWQFGSGNANDYATPTTGSMSVNGAQVTSGDGPFTLNVGEVLQVSNPSPSTFGQTGLGQYYVTAGGTNVPQRFYIGDVGEVLAYNTVLSSSDAQQTTSYLMSKWLGTTLPGNNILPTTTSVNISNGGTFDMTNGTQTIAALNSIDGNGSKVLLGNGALTVTNATNATFDGVISGSGGSVTLLGPGKQVFSGANTYNGGTLISGGTLQLGDGAARNGNVAGNITNNSALVFANPLSQTYTGVVSGTGPLTKTGAGVLLLTSTQGYAGPTTILNGTLRLGRLSGVTLSGFGSNTTGSAPSINNGTWTFNTVTVTQTPVTGGTLELTDGGGSERRSAFFNIPVAVNRPFTANFTYRATPAAGADGMAFIIQNDPLGLGALATSGGGSGLGYGDNTGTITTSPGVITPSAAVEFNIYNGHTVGTAYYTMGVTGTYNATGSVNIASGDPIQVTLTYDGSSTLTEFLKDLSTSATYSTSYGTAGSFASLLGSTTGYVGFSAATGGATSTQVISDFSTNLQFVGPKVYILPATTDLSIASGGTLDLNGGVQAVNSLTGAGVINSSDSSSVAQLAITGSTATTFSGSIRDGLGRTSIDVSSGTLTLSGSGNFTGGATVNGGSLIVTNAGAIGDGSNLSVGDPTLLLMLPAPVVPAAVAASATAASPVPEPGTLALLAIGTGAAVAVRARRRRRK